MKAKRQKIRALSLILLTLILASSLLFLTAGAADEPTPPEAKNCRAACLYDKTHNKMLIMKNPDELLNTSTSAKVMTGLIACEMLSDRLDEKVTITAEMLQGASGYSMRLSVGEEIKIIDLL